VAREDLVTLDERANGDADSLDLLLDLLERFPS
jgi:hypothetical protein